MMQVNVLTVSPSNMQDPPVVGGYGWVIEMTTKSRYKSIDYAGVLKTEILSPSHFTRLIFHHSNHSAGLVKSFH
jgi:hypothetical protein